MNYLDLNEDELTAAGAFNTAKEIAEQPKVWNATYNKFISEKQLLGAFWAKAKGESKKIILTGAGTSAYIGYSLEGIFQRLTKITTVSVATTHLVTHPHDYLDNEVPTLMVSFARSGNSPESVAAVKLADEVCSTCYHLVVTCDGAGALAAYDSKNEKFTFVLPPESNDKSLAMTSSYTSMLLTGLLIARIHEWELLAHQVKGVVSLGTNIINKYTQRLAAISKLNFSRAVFLGSGPMFGTATESHLKLQELTDGKVICKNDSFLGFRHGPKAVVNDDTLVVFLFSNKKGVLKYETDLAKAMIKEKKAMRLIGISETSIDNLHLDEEVVMSENGTVLDEEFLAVCSVLPAQILGFYKSLQLGLKPDNPSVSGTISRVVEGVIIYEGLV